MPEDLFQKCFDAWNTHWGTVLQKINLSFTVPFRVGE